MTLSEICGWLGGRALGVDATAVLNGMLASAPVFSDAQLSVTCGRRLAIRSTAKLGSIFQDENINAGLVGRVRWANAELDSLSRQHSPAHALATGYRRHGKEVLKMIRGPFACAVIDNTTDINMLAIDRMGIYPICYAANTHGIVFGSTAEHVTAHPAVTRDIDAQGIYHYLFFHMIPAPGTAFHGINKLLPGEYLVFKEGRTERGFYWNMPYDDNGSESFDNYKKQFKILLRQAVERNAEVGAGAFLSGGTDSSTISGILTQVIGQPANTYSIGFDAEGYDEMAYARIASRHFGTSPHDYYVTPDDVVSAVPHIAAAYDAPFGNASAIPTYYCAKLAHENSTRILLAGDGGDELFGGNVRYAKQKVFEMYSYIPSILKSFLIEPVAFHAPGADKLSAIRKLRSYIEQARIPLPQRLESYNFIYRDTLESVLEPDILAVIRREYPEELMREVYDRSCSHSMVNRMMHLDLKQVLADNDLPKVGRMCALAGIEVRYPMLDDDLVEFSARLPPALKIKGLKLRFLFKEALRDFLPPEIITKTKHGFGLPFGLWMKNHSRLRDLAYDSLATLRNRGYVRTSYIDTVIDRHRSSHADYYGVMVWVLMMLEQWLETHPPRKTLHNLG